MRVASAGRSPFKYFKIWTNFFYVSLVHGCICLEAISRLDLLKSQFGDMSFLFSKQLFHGTPVTIENFLSWKAKFDAELLEIKKKRMKEEEQAGKNKLSGMAHSAFLFPTNSPVSFLM